MSRFLDTSVTVRYLTGDPPDIARRAAAIVEGVDDVLLTGVVLAETAFVLRSYYRVPREAVVDSLIAFVQRENVVLVDLEKPHVLAALLLCRPSGRVSVADALTWAAARAAGGAVVYSFDERFPTEGIEVRRDAP